MPDRERTGKRDADRTTTCHVIAPATSSLPHRSRVIAPATSSLAFALARGVSSLSGRFWTKSRLMIVAVGRFSLSDTSEHKMLKAFN